jgi:hypothetical protein
MMRMQFVIDGKNVQPKDLQSDLDVLIFERLVEELDKSIGSFECPDHKQNASLIISGKSLCAISIVAQGCCEVFTKKVQEKIANDIR